MSLAVDGVWKTGAWATTVWASGVWREGTAAVAQTARGGYGLPTIVKPIKRHKKLDTFREELERLIIGVQEVAQESTEEAQPAIETAAQKIDAISERFNIVQTFDDQALISGQMEMLRQDFEEMTNLFQTIQVRDRQKERERQFNLNQEEVIILLLASEVL